MVAGLDLVDQNAGAVTRTPMWRPWLVPASGVVAAIAVMVSMRTAIPDDAYITLGYARELLAGRWAMVPGLAANSATSPLNVVLLAAGLFVSGGRPVVAVTLVLGASLAVVGWAVSQLPARRGPLAGVAAVTVLVSSPVLISTVGLETFPTAAVLALLAVAARAERWPTAGVLLGAAVLARPDLAVPALVLVAGLLSWRRWAPAVVLGAAVALPWHLFAWVRLGGFAPDTLFLKYGESSWEGYRFADGVGLYWRLFPAATALTVALIVAGMLAAVVWRRRVPLVLAAAGVAHWAGMALLDPSPYAWYFSPLIALTVLALIVALTDAPRLVAWPAAVLIVAVCALSLILVADRPRPDVGAVVYNWGSSPQYLAAGRDIAAIVGDAPVNADLEIGAVAWACHCRLSNMFTDRAVTDTAIADRLAMAGSTTRAVMAWNFAHRPAAQPATYRWSLHGGAADTAAVPGQRWVWPSSTPAHAPGAIVLERLPG